jgi:hypothetical protein
MTSIAPGAYLNVFRKLVMVFPDLKVSSLMIAARKSKLDGGPQIFERDRRSSMPLIEASLDFA